MSLNKRLPSGIAFFKELEGKKGYFYLKDIEREFALRGLRKDDPRLSKFFKVLNQQNSPELKSFQLEDSISTCEDLINNTFSGSLVISDFQEFSKKIKMIYESVKGYEKGKLASYIPWLEKADSKKFGVSVCTIDGQRLSIGDTNEYFSIQSCFKPINYLLALEENGQNIVHQYIGREPSGHSFNEITLDCKKRPHNPMINAGAIMSSALIKPNDSSSDRFHYVLDIWKKLSGGFNPSFNNEVYLSERQSADRNFALSYFMREHGSFPPNIDIIKNLEFYIQCCSIELTTDIFSIVAATLARSGECPLTGEQVFDSKNIRNCLSLMYSSGMYDFSGEFAFSIGIPAKSGVGGGLILVVPGVLGICIWSPLLDSHGNSARGIEFSRWLVELFDFHNYSKTNYRK